MNPTSSSPQPRLGSPLATMALGLTLLTSCAQLSKSFAGGASTSTSSPARTAELSTSDSTEPSSSGRLGTGNAHDRFSVIDVKIGMPVEAAGFTCTPATDGEEREDRHCVKFLDKRCAGQPLHIGVKRYSDQAPLGCFYDRSNGATYLDGRLMQENSDVLAGVGGAKSSPERRPLTVLAVVGTKAKPSRIYSIRYQFEYDDLTPDSKLYKALSAKYGPPDDRMKWKDDSTQARAECSYLNCNLYIEDSHFEEVEDRKQEESDAVARRKNAPAPPKL